MPNIASTTTDGPPSSVPKSGSGSSDPPSAEPYDVLVILSKHDRTFGADLKHVLRLLGLSVLELEPERKLGLSEKDASGAIDRATGVVIVSSELPT